MMVRMNWETTRRSWAVPLVKGMAERKSVMTMREPTLEPYKVNREKKT